MDLFGGGQVAQVAPPVVTAPTVMPQPDDKAIQDKKRRARAALQQRSGRDSTILSQNDNTDTLG